MFGRLTRKVILGAAVSAAFGLAIACASAPSEPAQPQQPAPAAPAPTAMPAAPAAPAAPQAVPAAPAAPLAMPAPTAAPPAPSGIKPTGVLMTATNDIRFPMGIPRFNQVASLHKTAGFVETPFHIARDATGNYITEPRLAMSFEVSPDLKYADVQIRRGVQFHDGWGEMTTEDMAWSYNDSSARVNPESVHDTAGDIAAMFLSTEAIDDDTVRFNFNVYASNWAGRILSDFWEGPPVYSKKVFDSLGVEGMRNTIVGTGPFQVVEYTQSKQIVMDAFEDHWNAPSFVERAVVLEVPEDAARRAMMETGEIAISNLPVKDWPDLLAKGFKQAPEGYYSEMAISFGGNWWDKTAIITGEPIERELDMSKPWVGNIDDPDQWEKARKFREALGYAIEREALNIGLFNSLGRIGSAPGWPREAPGYKDEWTYDYDLGKAKQLLNEAGYGSGASTDFWVGPSGVGVELGEAIAGIWEAELNIKTNFDRTQYNSTFRPSIIKRSVNKMWFCGTDGVNVPNLWPKGFLVSTVSNGGFMCGTEHRPFGEVFLGMSQESDPQKLLDLAVQFHDELRRTSAQIGVVDVPFFPLYNADKIAEWSMHPEGKGSLGGFNSMWTVKLK